MLLQFVFCKLLFITLIYASNSTSPEREHDSKTVVLSKNLQDSNKTKITMVSEGGTIVSSASTLTLPEDIHNIPLSLDKELDKTKERTVVPRKGVKYTPLDDDPTSLHSTELKNNDKEPKRPVIPQQDPKELASKMDVKDDIHKLIGDKLNTTNKNVSTVVQTPLKPLVVSYESLSEMDQPVKKERLNRLHTEINSSPDPDINTIRVQTVNASHPGMIMPIIITILTVPLFAVLGYLALRRGQEAWKNRHYKRMDFLLDGMYND